MSHAETLVVSHDDVVRLLPMTACIDLMGETLASLARGEALLPLRTVMRLPGQRNMFAAMPAVLGPSIGAKVITVFPDNEGTPFESHIGVVLYFENTNGRLLAIIDASSVTAIRTAAVSGLATRLLAAPTARTLAILGSGVQAMTHLEAMCAVRDFTTVRVWSRHLPNAEAFAERARAQHGRTVEVVPTAEAAVRGADVICTTTSSREPIVRAEWVAPGAHINAVGASQATARELDSETVRRARLYVDRRESVMAEAGDFLIPREEGVVDNQHVIGELGELVLGRVAGRTAPGAVTLFKSLGIAIEDVASARFLYERARELGTGTWVAIGGMR